MAEREMKKKSTPAREEHEVVEAPATSEQGEKIKAELDDLLDEIDEVLESNAEEFVKSYVQKGGERSTAAPPRLAHDSERTPPATRGGVRAVFRLDRRIE